MCGGRQGLGGTQGEQGFRAPSEARAGRPGRPQASAPRGLSPRLTTAAGPKQGRDRDSGGQQGQTFTPAAPYLGSGRSREARSGEFADSGQSTRTSSGGRGRRTEAQRERLTDPGNDHCACAARPRGGFCARAQTWRAPKAETEECPGWVLELVCCVYGLAAVKKLEGAG